ncbi:MAG: phosphate ABC transporter permease PstA [Ardenticatenaceae bacterium]|nr:phosphate ABC transporter permease PstA [Ardenticatenaceae bacterium]
MNSVAVYHQSYRRRKLMDWVMRGLTAAATGLALLPLFLILGYTLVRGGSSLNWAFFTQTYKAPVVSLDTNAVQAAGGVLHGIVGTFLITGITMLMAVPIGVLAGIFLSEYEDTLFSQVVRFSTDVLSGAPSIVVGVVGYLLIVQRYKQYSALAGSVALTFLAVPVVVRTTEEVLKLVPDSLREAAIALGAPRWHVTFNIVIPAALGGIVTGIMLAFARAAGETAPLLLTTIGLNSLSFDVTKQMAALPLLAYRYTGSPFPAEQNLAWGAALVLTVIVLAANIFARWVTGGRVRMPPVKLALDRIRVWFGTRQPAGERKEVG